MKKIYIECNMGVAGDMLCGALLDTLEKEEQNKIVEKLSTLMDGVAVEAVPSVKCGIGGTKFDVIIKEDERYHHHTSLDEVYQIIDGFDIGEKVKANAKAVYGLVAQAESKVHGVDVADIHLHEVGAKDAIVDITSFCYILDYMNIEKINCSPIVTGFGEIKAAHGILSVPAPATAQLLIGIENSSGDIRGELTTPTGAGLIKYFADNITQNNTLTATKIGYGMGTKDFEKPNCVRIFIGDEKDSEDIFELRCQVDDMTGEEMGYAISKLISLGAKDAFVTPITMKKGRPAFALTVISTPEDKDNLTQAILKHTTTLGVRQVACERVKLSREIIEKNCVSVKRSSGNDIVKEKIEFDQLAKIADEKDISIFEARNLVK